MLATAEDLVDLAAPIRDETTIVSEHSPMGSTGAQSVSTAKAFTIIVDDDKTNRKLLSRGLQRLGYSMHQAADGQEAVDACRQRFVEAAGGATCKLGLVVMDKSMPVMDGIEATRAIRAEFGDAFVIVGLTGDALGPEADEFTAAGLDGILSKPASAKDVHRWVVGGN